MFQAQFYLVNKILGSAFKDLTFVAGGSVVVKIFKKRRRERDYQVVI